MRIKTKTIAITGPWREPDGPWYRTTHISETWRVEQITDSMAFKPGQRLARQQVEHLCASTEWEVTITGPTLRQYY